MRDATIGTTLLKRFAGPEEIVVFAAFPASGQASCVAGANYAMDDGGSA